MASLHKLRPGAASLTPDVRLVPAAEYEALVEAERVLEEARAQAAAITAEARSVYESERERGYADGRAEAAAHASEQQFDVVARTVAWFGDVEERMVEVTAAVVRKILGDIDESELIVRTVHQAMRTMRNQRQVTVRVAHEMVEAVQQRLTAIMADYPGITFVEVAADGRLRRGGCILESELGTVDASVDVQLEALGRALRRAFTRAV